MNNIEINITNGITLKLKLKSCIVRSWRKDDAEAVAKHANNRRIWENLRDMFPHPYHLKDAAAFIDTALKMDPETYLCIASLSDEAIGSIGFVPNNDVERFSAEIGYWLSEDYWGQGILTEALKATTEWAMEIYGFNRLYAQPFEGNVGSVRVLEKAGYVFEGCLKKGAFKDGRFVDKLLYAHVKASI